MHGWSPSRTHSRGCGRRFSVALAWLALCALVTALVGCDAWSGSGSQAQTPEELEAELAKRQEKFKKEEKKPDYQVYPPLPAPYPPLVEKPQADSRRDRRLPIKPGHWTTVGVPVQANVGDLLGAIELSAMVNSRGSPSLLGPMAYWLRLQGITAVPKGQTRMVESPVFLPAEGTHPWLQLRLIDRLRRREVFAELFAAERMPPYQYLFVVLARNPDQYGFLTRLDSFRYPLDLSEDSDDRRLLRTVLLAGDRPSSLPASGLCWTTIAGMLWDEADPDALTPAQQQVLLDWLHWGGQLVVSGPGSLDLLKGSFLEPYLPAISAGSRSLGVEELRALDAGWSPRGRDGVVRVLRPARPWPAVHLQKHPEARFLPQTGELLAERRVGRGRIVVSAFALSTQDLRDWAGYDGLVNACLLGRPPRRFRHNPYNSFSTNAVQAGWEDRPLSATPRNTPHTDTMGRVVPGSMEVPWGLNADSERADQLDPLRVCRLWYLARDGGRVDVGISAEVPVVPNPVSNSPGRQPGPKLEPRPPPDPWCWFDASQNRLRGCGVAGWSDFNPLADAARRALQDAARIEIPDAHFVLWVVGVYLAVLVPLNYAVFRLLGRLEWAWFAVPVLALAGSVIIIRLARLDIGFERAVTEIALVEVQPNYRRGHVARYTGLYTGLYTEYSIQFEDPGAQALPFPTVAHPAKFDPEQSPRPVGVTYRSGPQGATLEGLAVASNSTNLLHTEQMLDLGGPVSAERLSESRWRVTNGTDYYLRGVGILGLAAPANSGEPKPTLRLVTTGQGLHVAIFEERPVSSGPASSSGAVPGNPLPAAAGGNSPSAGAKVVFHAGWVGQLRPGQSAEVELEDFTTWPGTAWAEFRDRDPLTVDRRGRTLPGELNLRELIDLASLLGLQPGETRLVAWIDQPIPGQEIFPPAPRTQHAAVLVAHLDYAFERDPKPDTVPRAMLAETPRVLRPTDTRRPKP